MFSCQNGKTSTEKLPCKQGQAALLQRQRRLSSPSQRKSRKLETEQDPLRGQSYVTLFVETCPTAQGLKFTCEKPAWLPMTACPAWQSCSTENPGVGEAHLCTLQLSAAQVQPKWLIPKKKGITGSNKSVKIMWTQHILQNGRNKTLFRSKKVVLWAKTHHLKNRRDKKPLSNPSQVHGDNKTHLKDPLYVYTYIISS